MNRYSQISTSQFNPMSFEQIMAAPSEMRRKHDTTLAAMEEIRAKNNLIDPHKKYFGEAKRLKDEMDLKLNNQADLLNSQGFSNDTTSQFLKINRENQELNSPTGKLGMINAHNLAISKTKEEYYKMALSHGQSESAARYWADESMRKHMEEVPLYDENGKVTNFEIDRAAVKRVDPSELMMAHAQGLKMSSEETKRAWSSIETSKDGNFTYVESGNSGDGSQSNKENIKSLVAFMNSQINNSSSEVRQHMDYNRMSPASVLASLKEQSGIYKQDAVNKESGSSKSNLIDNRVKSSKEDDDFSEIYSNSSETTSLGDNADEISSEANSVLNNPKSTKQEKQLARQKLDLVDEVKDELSKNNSSFENKNKYLESLKNSKYIDDVVKEAEKDKSPNLANLKQLQKEIKEQGFSRLNSDPKSQGQGRVQIEDYANVGKYGKKYSDKLKVFYDKHRINHMNFKKENDKLVNDSLSKRGLEETTFTQDMKPADRESYFQNIKDALSSDVVKASSANYINSSGQSEKIEINERSSKEMISLLSGADSKNGDIMKADPARQGGTVGVKIQFRPKENSETYQEGAFKNKSFSGNEMIEMYIPISEYKDGQTGMNHTSTRVYNNLPPQLKREFDKMVRSSGSGSSSKESRVGSLGVSANEYFPSKYSDGETIDFLKTKSNGKNSYTPYVVNKNGSKKPMKWSDGIQYDRLKDSGYVQQLASAGLFNNIIHSYVVEKGSNNLPKTSNNQVDYSLMLNYLKNKNLKLPETQDIIEFSDIN